MKNSSIDFISGFLVKFQILQVGHFPKIVKICFTIWFDKQRMLSAPSKLQEIFFVVKMLCLMNQINQRGRYLQVTWKYTRQLVWIILQKSFVHSSFIDSFSHFSTKIPLSKINLSKDSFRTSKSDTKNLKRVVSIYMKSHWPSLERVKQRKYKGNT